MSQIDYKKTNDEVRRDTVKKSVGMILVRNNLVTSEFEVLLVHKRYTYAFSDFVFGKYDIYKLEESIKYFLSQMTIEELLIVYTLDFAKMWGHIWLTNEDYPVEVFNKKHSLFLRRFMNDNGIMLTNWIKQAIPTGVLMWGLPKGKRNPNEMDINCAVREVKEETNIDKEQYRILPKASRLATHKDAGVEYQYKYFIAVMPYAEEVGVKLFSRPLSCIAEIDRYEWISVRQIRQMAVSTTTKQSSLTPGCLLTVVAAVNYAKKHGY
jgi:ADP-ribose pyrophosphatase YjhB (NUDIX family)